MCRHHLERGLALVLLGVSIFYAIRGRWNQANYFLFLAAVIDFDDWSLKKG
jgi:phosphatidylserine synthase